MLRVIYKKNRTGGFFQNRTETEPNLKNPFRTSLLAGHAVDVLLYAAYTALYSYIGYMLYSLRGYARFSVLRLTGKAKGKGPSIHLI